MPLDALIKVGEANESLAINELISKQYEVLIELSPTRRQNSTVIHLRLSTEIAQKSHFNSIVTHTSVDQLIIAHCLGLFQAK